MISTALKLWPCPGLSEVDDPRIVQYFSRIELGSAGGRSERLLAREMFEVEYSQLTPSQKETVALKQNQTHRWRLDHSRKRVFAIGEAKCLENVSARSTSTGEHTQVIEACKSCKAVLSLREFLTAIARLVPADKNRAYVPHRFQNSAIGQMYARNRGLGDLLAEVRMIYTSCKIII